MIKVNLLNIAMCVLIAFVSFLGGRHSNKQQMPEVIEYKEDSRLSELFNSIYLQTVNLSSQELIKDSLILDRYFNKDIQASDRLVLYFSDARCNTCIESFVEKMIEHQKIYDLSEKMVVVVESSNPRYTRIFKQKYPELKSEVVQIKPNSSLSILNTVEAVAFVSGKSNNSSHIYIVNSVTKEYFDTYLLILSNHFQNMS